MPTVSYKESITSLYEKDLAEYEALSEENQRLVSKPELVIVPGLEEVIISYPDEWLYKHKWQYEIGSQAAPQGAGWFDRRLYGTVALCDAITGIDLENLGDLPPHFIHFFSWLIREVWVGYDNAFSVSKKNT